MATIVANGGSAMIRRATKNNDGEFQHAFAGSNTISKSSMKNAKVYGPQTVIKNGVAYPNATWAKIEVVPVEHPYKKGLWVHPDRVATIKAQYQRNAARENRQARESSKNAVSGAVSRGLNNASDAIGKAPGVVSRGAKSIADAANASRQKYIDEHTNVQIKPKDGIGYPEFRSYTGNKVGEAAAAVRGAASASASAVGRAGKAAFESLMGKIKDSRAAFDKAIDKYVTGKSAGANRQEVLEAGSRLIGQIRGAMGMLGSQQGRYEISRGIDRGLNSALGAAAGLASGIARSNAGQAVAGSVRNAGRAITGGAKSVGRSIANSKVGSTAINAGKAVFSTVSSGVGNALTKIKGFFNNVRAKGLSRGAARA